MAGLASFGHCAKAVKLPRYHLSRHIRGEYLQSSEAPFYSVFVLRRDLAIAQRD